MRIVMLVAALAAAEPAHAAPSASWSVDKSTSRLGFTGSMSGQPFDGNFRRWDARIQFDPKNLAASRVTVAIDTGSATTGDQTRDEALPTADWFSSAVFPRASFESHQFRDLGNGRYLAAGILSIRNVRRPVALPFELAIKGDKAMMRGSLTIDRRLFGVGQGQFASGETVATAVRIDVALDANRIAH